MITYKLIAAGEQKVKVMSEVVNDENVNFLWEIATDISDEKLKFHFYEKLLKSGS